MLWACKRHMIMLWQRSDWAKICTQTLSWLKTVNLTFRFHKNPQMTYLEKWRTLHLLGFSISNHKKLKLIFSIFYITVTKTFLGQRTQSERKLFEGSKGKVERVIREWARACSWTHGNQKKKVDDWWSLYEPL